PRTASHNAGDFGHGLLPHAAEASRKLGFLDHVAGLPGSAAARLTNFLIDVPNVASWSRTSERHGCTSGHRGGAMTAECAAIRALTPAGSHI
ncbi:MAG: hypothetical protein WAO08_33005, partial [Hyphomicrobiaceae bacterium]